MGAFEGLIYGLSIAIQPEMLLAALIGVVVGSIVGIIPGLGPMAGAAILFPLTFAMSPTAGLIMIAGIYYGVMYGGSTTAVLLNIPGESVSIVASFEGYPMAQQGRAGPALGIIAFGSFIAGTISVVLVTIASPRLARIGLMFGPAEFFALTFGGLLVLSRMLGGSLASGLLPMFVGIALGTVGPDIASGAYRYTFGVLELGRGISLVPIAIGLFGISEILRLGEAKHRNTPFSSVKFRDVLPGMSDIRQSLAPWGRGGLVGFFFGLLPGPSATLGTFMSYRLEKAISKEKHKFGKGAIAGLAGPEAANNAAATSSIIPVLALGIPFSAVLALMLGALISHGIDPGPQIVNRHPEIFWGVIGSLYIGNLMLLIINVPMIGIWVRMLKVPKEALIPLVIVMSSYGAFAVSRGMLDVLILMLAGFLGYVFRVYGFQLAPVIVGLILGPLIERHFVATLTLGRGDPAMFLSSTVTHVIWGSIAVMLFGSFLLKRLKGRGLVDPESMLGEQQPDGPGSGSELDTDDSTASDGQPDRHTDDAPDVGELEGVRRDEDPPRR